MARRCKHKPCTTELPPARQCTDIIQKKGFCGLDCLAEHGREKAQKRREAKNREYVRKGREKLKTRSDYAREAQQAVNAYVRLRDMGKPCVSCDKPDDGTHQRHASHYRSVGACSSLRFNLKNIYASCQQCNTAKSGNIIEYRLRLRERYGSDLVEWLESQNGEARYSVDYLKRLKRVFNKRVRMLKKRYNVT